MQQSSGQAQPAGQPPASSGASSGQARQQAPPLSPAPSQASQQSQPQPQANTSINIAILDSKDFPNDVAPLEELYSDFAMADGRVLFECEKLTKTTGIDLMNCPLNIILKLHVRRRMAQGPVMLWHVVVPLPVISKYLLNAPFEWETWIGLLPNTQSLDSHPPETMFTQAVHLISRPEFPKLRLRFTYNNPELQAQISAQREQAEQAAQRRDAHNKQIGQANFQDIFSMMKPKVEPKVEPKVKETGGQAQSRSAGYPRDPLMDTTGVANTVVVPSAAPVMVPPEPVVQSDTPQLKDVVEVREEATPASSNRDVEQLLVEGLRMALMGMLDDSDGAKIPRTSTNLSSTSTDQMQTIRGGYPNLWQLYREVSHLAKERATLLSQQHELQERCMHLSREVEQHRSNPSQSEGAETKKHFEKLLNQQRQALQLGFDTETAANRQKIEEFRRIAQERESEVVMLREQLNEFMRNRNGKR